MTIAISNLEEIVEYGSVILVDHELEVIITWNGSSTFLWWRRDYPATSKFINVDIMTRIEESNLHRAIYQAEQWLKREIEDSENS